MNTKTIEIILKGLLAQDPDLCLKRLSVILSCSDKDSPIDALVNGVIVDALIASDQDEALVRADFTKQYDRDDWERFEVFVDNFDSVRVRGVYKKTVYCTTQENADSLVRTGYGNSRSKADETYKIPVVIEDRETRCYNRENAPKYGITLVLN